MAGLLTSACIATFSQNDDGMRIAKTSITPQELNELISSATADPLITDVTVFLQEGYISVAANRQSLNDAGGTDTLSIRLDLLTNNGRLIASITDAQHMELRLTNSG